MSRPLEELRRVRRYLAVLPSSEELRRVRRYWAVMEVAVGVAASVMVVSILWCLLVVYDVAGWGGLARAALVLAALAVGVWWLAGRFLSQLADLLKAKADETEKVRAAFDEDDWQ